MSEAGVAERPTGGNNWAAIYSFRGRATRLEFWSILTTTALLAVGLSAALLPGIGRSSGTAIGLSPADEWTVSILLFLILFVPAAAVSVRRLHDIGLRGVWIVPLVVAGAIGQWAAVSNGVFEIVAGGLAAIGFGILALKPGTPGSTEEAPAFSMRRLRALLVVPAFAAAIGFALLRLGPVEATSQRLVRPSVQTQLVLELNSKDLLQEAAAHLGQVMRDNRLVAATRVEIGESIRLRAPIGTQLNAEALARVLDRFYPKNDYRDIEVKSASDVVSVTFGPIARSFWKKRAMEIAMLRLRDRLAGLGVWNPIVQQEGESRILVVAPGYSDLPLLKSTLAQRGRLSFHAVQRELTEDEGKRHQVSADTVALRLRATTKYFVVHRAHLVGGADIASTELAAHHQTGEKLVLFRLGLDGARRFGQFTTANVNKTIAFVVDDEVVNTWVIREPILGGSGQIAGLGEIAAKVLSIQLRSGALPATFTVVEERVIGSP